MFENWGAHIPHWIQPKEQERKSEHERDMALIIVRRFPMYGEQFSILSDVPVAMPICWMETTIWCMCSLCVLGTLCILCIRCVCLNSEATYIQPNTLCAGFENSNRYRAIVAHIELLLETFIVLVCVYSGKPKLFDTWCFHSKHTQKNESLSRIRYVEKEMSVLKSRNSSIEIDQFRILVRLISKWCDVIDSTACKCRIGNIKWRYMTNFCHSLWYYLMLLLPVGFAKM